MRLSGQQISSISKGNGVKRFVRTPAPFPPLRRSHSLPNASMLFDRCAAQDNAALTHPANGAQIANYGRNVFSCPSGEQSIGKIKGSTTRKQFRSRVHLFRKTFASQDSMFSARQSDSRALANAAPTAVFCSSTSLQQVLAASSSSLEFPCITNIALPFPTTTRSTL